VICQPCRTGAELYKEGKDEEASAEHLKCPGGTWCDCAHGKPETGKVHARS
jgi:hypothetical protein